MKVAHILEADEKEDVSDEPTYVMPDEAEVAKHVYPFLVQKIEKLNKRAIKNKLPQVTLAITKEYMKEVKGETGKQTVEIPYYTVKIAGEAPKIAGYKFIATIEHQEGGNIIRTVPGEEGNKSIKDFYEAKPHYCDHCKKVRRRIDTFIVKEEKTGKMRQIGRNCLADFLGGADPKAILWYFNNRDNIYKLVDEASSQAEKKGTRFEQFIPLDSVLLLGSALVREFGYMSSKAAQEAYDRGDGGRPTTAGDIRWALFSTVFDHRNMDARHKRVLEISQSEPSPIDVKYVKEVLDWFNALPDEQKQNNEFMHNLDVIIKSDKVNPRNIGYAVALFPVYARAMGMIKQKEDTAKKSNEWLGAVGQKLPPTKVKVIRTRSVSGQFGTTQIVAMEDPNGNQLTWFNNGSTDMEEDKEYTIVGTVKKHDVYNGRKQTTVLRVKAS